MSPNPSCACASSANPGKLNWRSSASSLPLADVQINQDLSTRLTPLLPDSRDLDLDVSLGHGERRTYCCVGGPGRSETASDNMRDGFDMGRLRNDDAHAHDIGGHRAGLRERPFDRIDCLLGLRLRPFSKGAGGEISTHGAGDKDPVALDNRAAVSC